MRIIYFSLSIILSVFLFLSCGTESTPTYTLTTSVNGDGTITPTGGEFKDGEIITLTANPSNGWLFSRWEGEWSAQTNPTSITMNKNYSVVGVFERRNYPLTIKIEGEGTVQEKIVSSPKTTEYPYETVIELTPNPSDGWRFVEWGSDLSGDEVPISITITEEKEVTVTFEQIIYLGENGITIMCPNGEVGDIGLVNGVEYEVVDRNLLIERRDEGSDLTKVCVSLVNDMSNLLRGEYEILSPFNQPIGNWDVSNVTLMNNMFTYTQFNQPIGEWDVNNVTDMRGMFWESPFNQPIGKWNVSKVEDMGYMFYDSDFNQPIGNWNVSHVKNMIRLFSLSPFNQSIGEWDVSNVTNMSGMFADSPFNQPIGKWNVSKVENMWKMFLNTPFNQPIGKWDVSNATNIGGIFAFSQFNQPISDWDVSNVTIMNSTFSASTFNQSIENWDVSSVTDMSRMFLGNNDFNQPIGNWNLSNVTTMDYMFMGSQFDQPIGEWDVSNVTNMDFMFRNSFFNQNISNWCVWRIGTEPSEFSQGSPLTPENKPKWGTCPD